MNNANNLDKGMIFNLSLTPYFFMNLGKVPFGFSQDPHNPNRAFMNKYTFCNSSEALEKFK